MRGARSIGSSWVCPRSLLSTKTKHIGAWVSAATIVAVYPANIWMAVDAGAPRNAEAIVAWVRLPLQIPLVLWALSHRRRVTDLTPDRTPA